MSRNLLVFLLSELDTVRVICRHANCGVTIELPVGQLGQRFANGHCPACNQLLASGGKNAFEQLTEAVRAFKAYDKTVGVEFVLPADGPKTP
jgi:hypothetical protein